MRKYILTALAALPLFLPSRAAAQISGQSASGQSTEQFAAPIPAACATAMRSEFISYGIRALAEKDDIQGNQYYVPLEMIPKPGGTFSTQTEIPYLWLDREVFVQSTGIACRSLIVNGQWAGRITDSRTPAQINISALLKDGTNRIELVGDKCTETCADTDADTGANKSADENDCPATLLEQQLEQPRVFLFSQPKIRVADYRLTLEPDSTAHHGILSLEIIMANSYNTDETVTVGYDIYSPQGKLLHYNFRDITVRAQSADTLRFTDDIWHTADNYWSAENPLLHYGQLTVRRAGRYTEYIPLKMGYGTTTHIAAREAGNNGGSILRNGKAIEIKAARYNAPGDAEVAARQISTLKKAGINTLRPDYPQPAWFYDLCDRLGMYVVEQANVNGEAAANDPYLLDEVLRRCEASYQRIKNHPCVIGFSPAGAVGNGYNIQRSYLMLKQLESSRPVIFDHAASEWNSDTAPIATSDGAAIINAAPAPAAKKTPGRK